MRNAQISSMGNVTLPPTLWEYYKQIKASGFLAVLPLLSSLPPPTVGEYENIDATASAAPTAYLYGLTRADLAHLWLPMVQYVKYEIGMDLGANSGNTYEMVIVPEYEDWRDVRTAILRASTRFTPTGYR